MPIATFENPPLNEVAFGAFFAPLAGLKTSHYGAFLARLRPDFDQTEDKQPIMSPGLTAFAGEWLPLPRVWFIHKEKAQLLQLQANRFYFNWRKAAQPTATYPRFDALGPLFEKYFSTFLDFLRAEELGVPDLNGSELTYTNHIPAGDLWTVLAEIPRVLPMVGNCYAPRVGELSGIAWRCSFETESGKLVADVKTGKLKAEPERGVLIFELKLTAERAFRSVEDLRAWFKEANGVIVSAFLELTSPEIQKEVWRRVGG